MRWNPALQFMGAEDRHVWWPQWEGDREFSKAAVSCLQARKLRKVWFDRGSQMQRLFLLRLVLAHRLKAKLGWVSYSMNLCCSPSPREPLLSGPTAVPIHHTGMMSPVVTRMFPNVVIALLWVVTVHPRDETLFILYWINILSSLLIPCSLFFLWKLWPTCSQYCA